MLRSALLASVIALPLSATAQSYEDLVEGIVAEHILPGYAHLAEETTDLADAARQDCSPGSPVLQSAFQDAFDAWMGVSHITFGPAEEDGQFYALAFWPDTRGMTGRGLSGLIADEDPVVADPEAYATVSVAARGFYAMEFLLFDPELSLAGDSDYHCQLVQAVAADIAATAHSIASGWTDGFADLMLEAGENDRFQSSEEAVRTLFGALTTGLEFTADLRLGRPLGSFDAPRPVRAEARRSGRSLRHVMLSLQALDDLAQRLAAGQPDLQAELAAHVEAALDRASTLEDPVFATVADVQGRLRIEVLQQRIRDLRDLASTELGPSLGVAAGFNSLDGD